MEKKRNYVDVDEIPQDDLNRSKAENSGGGGSSQKNENGEKSVWPAVTVGILVGVIVIILFLLFHY